MWCVPPATRPCTARRTGQVVRSSAVRLSRSPFGSPLVAAKLLVNDGQLALRQRHGLRACQGRIGRLGAHGGGSSVVSQQRLQRHVRRPCCRRSTAQVEEVRQLRRAVGGATQRQLASAKRSGAATAQLRRGAWRRCRGAAQRVSHWRRPHRRRQRAPGAGKGHKRSCRWEAPKRAWRRSHAASRARHLSHHRRHHILRLHTLKGDDKQRLHGD